MPIVWLTFPLLVEVLPVAVLPPVLAAAAPVFTTKASWSMITRPPSEPPAEPLADWMTCVSDLLPVADALPVLTVALPSERLVALPSLAAMPAAEFASCTRPAPLVDSLPVAELPPVFARATPLFVTTASWLMTRMPPSWPWAEPTAVWLIVVFDWLPTAEALPVEIVAVPFEPFAAWPVLVAGPRPEALGLVDVRVVGRLVADRDVAAGVGDGRADVRAPRPAG